MGRDLERSIVLSARYHPALTKNLGVHDSHPSSKLEVELVYDWSTIQGIRTIIEVFLRETQILVAERIGTLRLISETD